MLVVLPALALIALYRVARRFEASRRRAVLQASVAGGAWVALVTEGLSLLGAVRAWPVAIVWAVLLAGSVVVMTRRPGVAPPSTESEPLPGFSKLLLAATLLLFAALAVIAVAAAPNTTDALAYHLGRIPHWEQAGTVAHFPTHIRRQLYMNPWAEYALLHLHLLSGGDSLDNLLQWSGAVGSAVAASLIAARLGARPRVQILAAVVCATIPMAVVQATTSLNDVVVTYWIVAGAALLPEVRRGRPVRARDAVLVGVALGLALLTKGTAYFFGAPVGVALCAAAVVGAGGRAWRSLLLVAGAIAVLNLGHWWRNYEVFGHPLGVPERFSNDHVGLGVAVSTASRDLANHLATPFDAWNAAVESCVLALHEVMGQDPNEQKISPPYDRFRVLPLRLEPYATGNLLHVVAILAALVVLACSRKEPRRAALWRYALLPASGGLLFCSIAHWMPWNSRLDLPVFALAAPWVAVVLGRRPAVGHVLAALLLAAALPWALRGENRPLWGPKSIWRVSREEQLFRKKPRWYPAYEECVRRVRGAKCHELALIMRSNDWDYPLWRMLRSAGATDLRIEHRAVTGHSRVVARPFEPDAVVVWWADDRPRITVDGRTYGRAWGAEPLTLYLPL